MGFAFRRLNKMETSTDEPFTLGSILKKHRVRLDPNSGNPTPAQKRLSISKCLASHFKDFNILRLHLFHSNKNPTLEKAPDSVLDCARYLSSQGLLLTIDPKRKIFCIDPKREDGREYLNGEWLEELVYVAFREAGAEESSYRQKILWGSPDKMSHFEVDVLARKSDVMVFSSCKAIRPEPEQGRSTELRRFMSEALSWDHLFAAGKAKILVVTTAEMVDRRTHAMRYAPLVEQARYLGEVLLGVEDLAWEKLCSVAGLLLDGKEP